MPTKFDSDDYLDDEVVLDRVIAALVERPCTISELFGRASFTEEPMPRLTQIDEALDILDIAGATRWLKDKRFGESIKVVALKSEARTYWKCTYCNGTGVQDNKKRGLCHWCHGNGLFTPLPDSVVRP